MIGIITIFCLFENGLYATRTKTIIENKKARQKAAAQEEKRQEKLAQKATKARQEAAKKSSTESTAVDNTHLYTLARYGKISDLVKALPPKKNVNFTAVPIEEKNSDISSESPPVQTSEIGRQDVVAKGEAVTQEKNPFEKEEIISLLKGRKLRDISSEVDVMPEIKDDRSLKLEGGILDTAPYSLKEEIVLSQPSDPELRDISSEVNATPEIKFEYRAAPSESVGFVKKDINGLFDLINKGDWDEAKIEAIKKILDGQEDLIFLQNDDGDTPLHRILQILIKNPTHTKVDEAFELLIKAYQKFSQYDLPFNKEGESILHLLADAIAKGFIFNSKIVDMLYSLPYVTRALYLKDKDGNPPLVRFMKVFGEKESPHDRLMMALEFFARGSIQDKVMGLDVKGHGGLTPLAVAAQRSEAKITQEVLDIIMHGQWRNLDNVEKDVALGNQISRNFVKMLQAIAKIDYELLSEVFTSHFVSSENKKLFATRSLDLKGNSAAHRLVMYYQSLFPRKTEQFKKSLRLLMQYGGRSILEIKNEGEKTFFDLADSQTKALIKKTIDELSSAT